MIILSTHRVGAFCFCISTIFDFCFDVLLTKNSYICGKISRNERIGFGEVIELQDLKQTIAKNISELRKTNKMTQLELAEKLNYSDKAVSKWERGESIPDVSVLVEIARVFSVTLDYLVSADHEKCVPTTEEERKLKEATNKVLVKNRKAITGIGIQMVWLVAIIVFIPLALFVPSENAKWLPFLYAFPVSAIVWLIFNHIWFNRRRNYLIISILMWTLLAAVHLTVFMFGGNLNYIYLLGLPGQLILVLWSVIRKKPSTK